MYYIRQSDNTKWHINEVRAMHPNTSLPDGGDASSIGYERLVETPRPEPTPWHKVVEMAPANNVQVWANVHLSNDEIIAIFTGELERHYDLKAQERRYDNRLTCAIRAGYPGPFQAEGASFAVWMDECNAYAYGEMEKVMSGRREIPSPSQLISELPQSPW